MKNIRIIYLIFAFYCIPNFSSAQNINWWNLSNEHPHLVNLNAGWDFGSTIGIGYGYKIKMKIPVVLNATYSMPFGKKLADDFKTKLGAQAELVKFGNFSASVKVNGIFRHYQNDLARFLNFGSEFSAVCGYYRPHWYAAAEVGFDKAIVTHVKHSTTMKEYNPSVENGWLVPTGGNFFYGIQTGISFKRNDVSLKLGKTVTQDLKTTATIPFYFQIGINRFIF